MLEIIFGIVVCVAMGKVASADDLSPLAWGFITFGICALTFFIMPGWPYVRYVIAAAVAFGSMIGYKVYANK